VLKSLQIAKVHLHIRFSQKEFNTFFGTEKIRPVFLAYFFVTSYNKYIEI